jgi:hypothetical protein
MFSYQRNCLSDLIPVCPNCHAVIHLKTPPYTPHEVSNILHKDNEQDQWTQLGGMAFVAGVILYCLDKKNSDS